MTRLIGLDVGTSSVKGLAADEHGRVLAEAERPHRLSCPRDGWAEQDPEAWWRGTQGVLAELDATRADAIGLSGQMHGLVALDGDGRVVRPAILWNDGRSQPQCDRLEDDLGIARLVELTGNRALAGFTAPKLMWMAEHEPDLHAQVRHVLLPKDDVRRRLLGGALAQEASDASGTLLFDVGEGGWSSVMCARAGVDASWLPEVLPSSALAGHARLGGRDVPVAAGAGDQAAGALGVGVVRAGGPWSLVVGTSGVVLAPQAEYRPEPAGRFHTFRHAAGETWQAMGVTLSAAGSLAWLQRAVGGSWAELLAEAQAWPPGCEGLVFAPYLAGERTPHSNAAARGGFLGLGLRHDRGALVRAVLEGVAYSLRDAVDVVAGVVGRPAIARVSGGGTRSRLWLEILAAVIDVPLEVVEVEHAAALGAALLGGVAAGVFVDEAQAAAATVRVADVVEPDLALVEIYAGERPAFSAAWDALETVRAKRMI